MYGNNRRGGFGPRKPPVEVGEELSVKIESVGEKGDGIAKKDGFVLFVPDTKEGQTVKIRVTKVLTKVGFADVVGEADESEIVQEEPKTQDISNLPDVEEEAPEDTEDFGEEASEDADEESDESDSEEAAEEKPADEEPEAEEPEEETSEEDAEEEKKEE